MDGTMGHARHSPKPPPSCPNQVRAPAVTLGLLQPPNFLAARTRASAAVLNIRPVLQREAARENLSRASDFYLHQVVRASFERLRSQTEALGHVDAINKHSPLTCLLIENNRWRSLRDEAKPRRKFCLVASRERKSERGSE